MSSRTRSPVGQDIPTRVSCCMGSPLENTIQRICQRFCTFQGRLQRALRAADGARLECVGSQVSEFVSAARYVPPLPALAQELRLHLAGRTGGYLLSPTVTITTPQGPSRSWFGPPPGRRASRSGSTPICCATEWRSSCSTGGCSRSSWGTRISRPPRSTPRARWRAWGKATGGQVKVHPCCRNSVVRDVFHHVLKVDMRHGCPPKPSSLSFPRTKSRTCSARDTARFASSTVGKTIRS